jgi:hypothetical protein
LFAKAATQRFDRPRVWIPAFSGTTSGASVN